MRSSDRSMSRPKQSATAATARPPRDELLPNTIGIFPSPRVRPLALGPRSRAPLRQNVEPCSGSRCASIRSRGGSPRRLRAGPHCASTIRPMLHAVQRRLAPLTLPRPEGQRRRRLNLIQRLTRASRCASPWPTSRCQASASSCSRTTSISTITKRVLLTAYADAEATIKAINDVSLDYYLLEPWTAEQLLPIVDDLLADWNASAASPTVPIIASLLAPQAHGLHVSSPADQVPILMAGRRARPRATQIAEDRPGAWRGTTAPCFLFSDMLGADHARGRREDRPHPARRAALSTTW